MFSTSSSMPHNNNLNVSFIRQYSSTTTKPPTSSTTEESSTSTTSTTPSTPSETATPSTTQTQPDTQQQKQEEGSETKKDGAAADGETQQEQQREEEPKKEKTFKEKVIHRLKWGTFTSVIVGTIGFLFYESYLRSSMPYRIVMNKVKGDLESMQCFGGVVAPLKWYECFTDPIIGTISLEEGGTECSASFTIPIRRFVPPPPKEGEVVVQAPEDIEMKSNDGGAQDGHIEAILRKKTSWFFDWEIYKLHVNVDTGKTITIVDKELKMPTRGYY
ncbi:hypothetical protein SAMD00019534_000800 [Acytostelium subglobosum LB1]|uniref:hypothetical protein n=1 Tax=Acytostelium subglobosum LB1 TaxID=1410327 RepID=UPI000644AEDB|nr:hypothetical protein SAMD00019534_000800 [Acytostelium subglobosum LB1]GAM16905.1 hypothetical protein SAMD00019534_000800 [Acytostelium subglobosum LB1]|eukprot:XP_012758967.1 hypothetical protein SAMD00019534_000800 [Acytostelium subglobosum LB1]